MSITQHLVYGQYYHIYNKGNNDEIIFRNHCDFKQFLRLYGKYIELVADTFAWCLLGDSFHFLIRVKEEREIGCLFPMEHNSSRSSERWKVIPLSEISQLNVYPSSLVRPVPYRQFSHLFNSYTKYFNRKYNRKGSLFEKNFKRIRVETEEDLKELVCCIHCKPVLNGNVDCASDYLWSSYQTVISSKSTKLKRCKVINWFESVDSFESFHLMKQKSLKIE
ncbi:MAG: transposase [Marinifilaceae bacterium]